MNMNRTINFVDMNDREFLHFDSEIECDNFINYIREKNINITHRCCSGIGCGINDNQFFDINKLKKDFLNTDIIKKDFNTITGLDCCVCYEKTAVLTHCNHQLCNECNSQLKKRVCPCCRRVIS